MAAIHAKNTLHAIWRQNIVNNLTSKKWVEQEKLQSQQPTYKKNINNNNNKILLSFLLFLSLLYIFTNNDIAYKFVYKHTITPVADTDEQTLCLKQHEGTMVASNIGTSATTRNITMENDTSTIVNMNALTFEVNSTVTTEVDSVTTKILSIGNRSIDLADAASMNIVISTDASYDTSNINVGTSATIRNITNGNDASCNEMSHCGVKWCYCCGKQTLPNETLFMDHFGHQCPRFESCHFWREQGAHGYRCIESICYDEVHDCCRAEHKRGRENKNIIHRCMWLTTFLTNTPPMLRIWLIGWLRAIFMPQGKYWHHDGNFFIFDPGGDTNNIYILLFFHLFH